MHYNMCPFCDKKMEERVFSLSHHSWCGCTNAGCEFHGQPRYQTTTSSADNKIISESFILDTYYISIDYVENTSKISTIDVVILLGTITLPKAIFFNLKNLKETLTKIKTLLMLS